MKKIILPISALFVVGLSHAQTTVPSTTENYVYSKTYLSDPALPNIKTAETVQYFDGLGRPKQVVNVKASPLGKDVVMHIEYDGFGRQVKDYLPVPQSNTLNGAIIPSPLANATQPDIYGSEKIYAEKILENSPLDRIRQQIQVGTDWSNKPVSFNYDANIDGEVKKFTATFNYTTFESALNISNSYGAAQLYKNTVTDEDGNPTIEFKNGQGQTLLVRKVISATEKADTYYVYNDYDQLAYVIPPLAAEAVKTSTTGLFPDVTLNNLCYQYKYDSRNRLAEKKLPGKGWEFMLYDKRDRLVASRDANLEAKGQWLFTKYDEFGRVAFTGISTGGSRATEQADAETFGTNNVMRTSSSSFSHSGMDVHYRGFIAYPADSKYVKLLSVNYYDTYAQYSFNPSFPANVLNTPVLTDNSTGNNTSTKSLPVMSFVKNIEDDNWTKNYTWYDTKGRAIGSHSINHLGGYTKTESELDFSGTPKRVYTYHLRKQNEAGIAVKERFVYDAQNRLLQHYHQVDDKPEELLAQNEYNELSQLTNKKVGNNLQSIDYAYNIRGWMTHINKDQMALANLGGKLFSYKIKYTQKDGITNPDNALFSNKNVTAKYNGNIAEVDWRSVEVIGQNPSGTPERYGYAYDGLNRLAAGYYQNPNNPNSKENIESLAYDLNGNITNLYRTSVISSGTNTATLIDNLSYTYTGNQATNINDLSNNFAGYEGGGRLIDYDLNGNMKSMSDKRIVGITYNYLNLPTHITQDTGFYVSHLYRADGVKLNKTVLETADGINGSVSITTNTDYLDGFQYNRKVESGGLGSPGGGGSPAEDEDSSDFATSPTRRAMEEQAFTPDLFEPIDPTLNPPGGGLTATLKTQDLQFFPTAEGFYDYIKDQYIYQYKDHLGNARVSFGRNSAGVLEITDANDYYPFGMNHMKTGNAFFGQGSYKSYKYNGKELQELGMYDYGARFYMPDLGRWGVQDIKSEAYYNYSQYQYVLNNPVINIDIKGQWTVTRHYNMTYNSLAKAGFGKKQADLIAHYASVYADNPGGHIHLNNASHPTDMMSYRKGIDYSSTANSQNVNYNGYGNNYNVWHSMRSGWEKDQGYTAEDATTRGMQFGWQKIFDSAKKGGKLSDLKTNSKGIQDFGLGIHALQDAYAHKGKTMDEHSVLNDRYGNTKEAERISTSAVNVHNLLTGSFDKIVTGYDGNVSISFEGMTSSMREQVMSQIYNYVDYRKKKEKEE